MIEIFFIAFGLSMDAFAVALTSGAMNRKINLFNKLKMAGFFGFFQGVMPILGFVIGLSLKDFIKGLDHWVAFGILGIIGIKMIYESMVKREKKVINFFNLKILFVLALATSLDALIIGVSFAFLNKPIYSSTLIIGLVTFLITFFGVCAGEKCNQMVGKKAETMGGLILILIGAKILIEHIIF